MTVADHSATYDLSAIMSEAWSRTHEALAHNPRLFLRPLFRRYLREAWVNAKTRMELARAKAELEARSVDCLSREIEHIENRSIIGIDGANRLAKLRCALARAREREDFAAKRELIATGTGRFVAVTFTKKDGAERTMTVQPDALRSRLKGEDASDAGRRASQTRAERHPNLMPVWDAQKRVCRSINLATISRIAANGQVHTFA
ncbi:hypothetical protein [Histidinibacterium aquaticum]|uniref:Uncharacterized protein n=1 Tax=Histidinibacterium aquaticum TaxID=2613962 RepID=A0A5J5GP98_9RHOB|nr:hypothetical protein [Histidinibacterium aquaticum]KAA9010159.1 hypothetical protein F3S47_02595 [Histidinibacterium aquaticum]